MQLAAAKSAAHSDPIRRTSFEDLVARTSAGDRGAETELVDQFGRRTFLLLRRLAGDREMAEDLYQETFRIVLVSLRQGKLRQPDKLAAFVRGTAKNLLRSEWEKRQRRGTHHSACDMTLVDESPDPFDRAVLAEDRAHISRMLEELPSARDRQVLHGHYLAHEEKSEICSRLGIATGQFNLILFRARRRFRRLVESGAAAREHLADLVRGVSGQQSGIAVHGKPNGKPGSRQSSRVSQVEQSW